MEAGSRQAEEAEDPTKTKHATCPANDAEELPLILRREMGVAEIDLQNLEQGEDDSKDGSQTPDAPLEFGDLSLKSSGGSGIVFRGDNWCQTTL